MRQHHLNFWASRMESAEPKILFPKPAARQELGAGSIIPASPGNIGKRKWNKRTSETTHQLPLIPWHLLLMIGLYPCCWLFLMCRIYACCSRFVGKSPTVALPIRCPPDLSCRRSFQSKDCTESTEMGLYLFEGLAKSWIMIDHDRLCQIARECRSSWTIPFCIANSSWRKSSA